MVQLLAKGIEQQSNSKVTEAQTILHFQMPTCPQTLRDKLSQVYSCRQYPYHSSYSLDELSTNHNEPNGDLAHRRFTLNTHFIRSKYT